MSEYFFDILYYYKKNIYDTLFTILKDTKLKSH
jgi:hypothetical protein